MSAASVYLGLAVVGVAIPYAFFVPWLLDHGLDLPLLWDELTATRISTFFAVDVVISAVALLAFIAYERRARHVPFRWVAVAGTLLVGVSFGLPAYLYLRTRGRGA